MSNVFLSKIIVLFSLVSVALPSVYAKESIWFEINDQSAITQAWSFDVDSEKIFWLDAQAGKYRVWNKAWKMPGYGTIAFTALATHDIVLGITKKKPWNYESNNNFYAQMINDKNFYELVIGGWMNATSAIRKGAQTNPLTTVDLGIPSEAIDNNLPVDYKIVFYQDESQLNTIAIYYRNPVPDNNKIWTLLMSYQDQNFIEAANRWICFSGWDVPVFYTNIEVSDKTTLPRTA